MPEQTLHEYEILPEEIASEYLSHGFSEEKLTIKNVNFDLEARTAVADVDVSTDFENSYDAYDNSFHWSAITAYRAVSQLAVGYICTELGKTKKQVGEIMQMSSNMNTTSPITQTKDVHVKVSFPKYIKREKRLLGELQFDVANRVFFGSMRFAINLARSF